MNIKKRYILALTGASGSKFGLNLLSHFSNYPFDLYLIISESAKSIMKHEMGLESDEKSVNDYLGSANNDFKLIYCENDDFYTSPASGSFRHDGMVVAPCSMKTLSEVANGYANNLISRASDVALKERKPLVLLTRETPLNLVHIENMKKAHLAGATIMPPVPSFYNNPQSIDDILDHTSARVLDQLGVEHKIITPWMDGGL